MNRRWDENAQPVADHVWQDPNFDDIRFIDDDVLGFMQAEAAKMEASDESGGDAEEASQDENKKSSKGRDKQTSLRKGKQKPKGKITARRGVLEVTRAVSVIPFTGDITFNAVSGVKGRKTFSSIELRLI